MLTLMTLPFGLVAIVLGFRGIEICFSPQPPTRLTAESGADELANLFNALVLTYKCRDFG